MRKPAPIPTLGDVARAANVSGATVSRCLNGKENVSQATRDKVMRAVETLGYTPNLNARSIVAKRSHTIGAIIPTMDNAIFARGIQAFQEGLHESGYTLLLASNAYRRDIEANQIRTLLGRGVDGLLLIGNTRPESVYADLARRDIPFVLAWSLSTDPAHACVGFDNRAAMRQISDRVISLGHRRIGMISGITAGNDRATERLAGVRDSMAAHGLNPDHLSLQKAPYDIDQGAGALSRMLAGPQRPTAVICGNDVLAAGAIWRAQALGLQVPGDLSITGFDDMDLARLVTPGLSTMHVPHRDMGRQAAALLVGMIEQGAPPARIELDTTLTLRGSLAAP